MLERSEAEKALPDYVRAELDRVRNTPPTLNQKDIDWIVAALIHKLVERGVIAP